MRILSKFKDYYDFISHRYGQDPNCTYIRSSIRGGKTFVEWKEHGYFEDTLDKKARTPDGSSRHMEFIVAGPHVFAIIVSYGPWDEEERRHIERPTELLEPRHDPLLMLDWNRKIHRPALPGGEKLNDLIRLVGVPVFQIRRREYQKNKVGLLLEEKIPILKDLGIPALVPAEVMWQDIYTTMTSVLRKDPDKAPPVQIEDKYRIEEAGFDLKTSFRHPINPKPKRRDS